MVAVVLAHARMLGACPLLVGMFADAVLVPGPPLRSQQSQVIVYAMGSLYTSLAPSLVLPGIGDIVRQKQCRKVLLLNGSYDRESDGLTASEFVWAVVNALANNRDDRGPTDDAALRPSDYVTDLVAPQGGQVGIDLENLQKMGVRLHMITARSKVSHAWTGWLVGWLVGWLAG